VPTVRTYYWFWTRRHGKQATEESTYYLWFRHPVGDLIVLSDRLFLVLNNQIHDTIIFWIETMTTT